MSTPHGSYMCSPQPYKETGGDVPPLPLNPLQMSGGKQEDGKYEGLFVLIFLFYL